VIKKLTYIIDTPAFDKSIGGICALHYLADCLHRYGIETVYLTTDAKNPRWYGLTIHDALRDLTRKDPGYFQYQTLMFLRKFAFLKTFSRKIDRRLRKIYPVLLWSRFNPEKTVVIYPETAIGNPLNAQNVVRWILYNPNISAGQGIYKETDHIFLYFDFYKVNQSYSIKGLLTAVDMDYHLNTFFDKGGTRKGGAYLVKKGKGKALDRHPKDYQCADDLLRSMSDQERADFFNKLEVFISYDPVSFFSMQAALCGCVSIVIPDQNGDYTKENLIKTNRQHGVAYDLDDISWAKDTLHLLRQSLEVKNMEYLQSVKKFIDYCEKSIK
jgi:hypothetical protein